jgi:hypothetical protein
MEKSKRATAAPMARMLSQLKMAFRDKKILKCPLKSKARILYFKKYELSRIPL